MRQPSSWFSSLPTKSNSRPKCRDAAFSSSSLKELISYFLQSVLIFILRSRNFPKQNGLNCRFPVYLSSSHSTSRILSLSLSLLASTCCCKLQNYVSRRSARRQSALSSAKEFSSAREQQSTTTRENLLLPFFLFLAFIILIFSAFLLAFFMNRTHNIIKGPSSSLSILKYLV